MPSTVDEPPTNEEIRRIIGQRTTTGGRSKCKQTTEMIEEEREALEGTEGNEAL